MHQQARASEAFSIVSSSTQLKHVAPLGGRSADIAARRWHRAFLELAVGLPHRCCTVLELKALSVLWAWCAQGRL